MENNVYQLAYNLVQTNMMPNDIYVHCVKLAVLSGSGENKAMMLAAEQFAKAYKQAMSEWNKEDEERRKQHIAYQHDAAYDEEDPISFVMLTPEKMGVNG